MNTDKINQRKDAIENIMIKHGITVDCFDLEEVNRIENAMDEYAHLYHQTEVEEGKIVYRRVSVKDRLPEKPIRPKGGQQVNINRVEWGIEKVVEFIGHDMPAIAGFHYISKKWYMGWGCRSGIVDETKYKDVTTSVTHWLEPVTLPIQSVKEGGFSLEIVTGFADYYYQIICKDKTHEQFTKSELFGQYLQSLPSRFFQPKEGDREVEFGNWLLKKCAMVNDTFQYYAKPGIMELKTTAELFQIFIKQNPKL